MKHLVLVVLATTALATTTAGMAGEPAPTAPSSYAASGSPYPRHTGLYHTLQGGALWMQDTSLGPVDLGFDVGFSVMSTLGWSFGNGLGLEIEAGYGQADLDRAQAGGLSAGLKGQYKQIPAFANAVYLVELTDRLSLYAGAGVGAIWSELEVNDIAAEGKWNLAFQGKAGASFKLTEAVSLNLGYRVLYGTDALRVSDRFKDDSLSHVVEGGLTIRF